MNDPHAIRQALASGALDAATAVEQLLPLARAGTMRAARVDAYDLLGEIAGRAFDAPWEVAERAAWGLIDLTRQVGGRAEKRSLILAFGRGFRNLWLLPFVHGRLDDEDPELALAAVTAAGGLGFAALEEAVASRFLANDTPPAHRLAAVAALGRMGAQSTAPRLVPLLDGDNGEPAQVLTALTEMRSAAGVEAALSLLDRDPPREVRLAAARYLSELGREEVLPTLRRLARHDDPTVRVEAGLCARALKAERTRDAGDRILVALTERDRAVRAVLARRLRTLPVDEVLAQARMLLDDDAEGVVQVLGEVHTAEVTHFLLEVAARKDLPEGVRARALGAIEANEPWERDALAKVIAGSGEERLRASAAQAMGAFATVEEVLRQVGPLAKDPSPRLRGALVWALQLATRPGRLPNAEHKALERELRRALGDPDAFVRRRAAYVTGNLQLDALAPDLLELARAEKSADLRAAAFTGLGELAVGATLGDLVGLFKREEDPAAMAAAGRALAATLEQNPDAKIDLQRVQGKVLHLLASDDATVTEVAIRLGALAGGLTPEVLLPLAEGRTAPRAREAALSALGLLAAPEGAPVLLAAMDDPDPAIRERAAASLISVGGRKPLERVLEYVAGDEDDAARARVAALLQIPPGEADHFQPRLDAALARLRPDDPAYELLVGHKLQLLAARSGTKGGAAAVEAAIVALFPMYAQLSRSRGFDALDKSLRTAEALYHAAGAVGDGDHSPPIMLWMKCLEGYVHAWLSPRMSALQSRPAELFAQVDTLLSSWPSYQRHLEDKWADTVDVGGLRVEVPLRSVANALRALGDRRTKRLDSPLSVTEWARMMLFFAVDHPAAGIKNVFKISGRNFDQVVRVIHRLLVLAAVRNVVTHRAAANAATVEAFRKSYYAAFEELTRLA